MVCKYFAQYVVMSFISHKNIMRSAVGRVMMAHSESVNPLRFVAGEVRLLIT